MATVIEEKKDSLIEKLFEAGGHIGYSKVRRHPKMREFIFGTRNNIEIINLEIAEKKIKEAEDFLKKLGKEGKNLLLVGTKPSAKNHIKEMGESLNVPFVVERWLGGTLTNFKVLGGRIAYLRSLEEEEKSGGFEKYAKKERGVRKIKLEKLKVMFNGLRNLKFAPGALIIVDPNEEKTALAEAVKKNIPKVVLLNIDSNPENIEYPIPMNHNSQRAVFLVLERLKNAYEIGLKEKPAEEEKEKNERKI